MEISPKVTAAIDKFFAASERPVVAELLGQYGDAAHERETERIHLLILKMSARNLEKIRDLVKAAKRDYRDVIAWASQPTRRYIVGLLRHGPNAVPGEFAARQLSSLREWRRNESIVIGGSSLEDGDFRGLYIFKVNSIEEAEALAASDPAIQSGQLRFEFHTWVTADGLQVGIPSHYLDIDVH